MSGAGDGVSGSLRRWLRCSCWSDGVRVQVDGFTQEEIEDRLFIKFVELFADNSDTDNDTGSDTDLETPWTVNRYSKLCFDLCPSTGRRLPLSRITCLFLFEHNVSALTRLSLLDPIFLPRLLTMTMITVSGLGVWGLLMLSGSSSTHAMESLAVVQHTLIV
ncbi:hypothetical protein PF008_g17034 [Phytophthora fragariae]|uniref:Uncharacterized protein n=1 Tax=Phytophthora fragariae TaxID=53985 RepID=A0A6G0R9Y2_9STRA|nr:hypothetical protein PF008_g17034 [Phytophthora fragariae]